MIASVESRENEGERYQKIIRRAKQVRERAAESLRRARASGKKRGDPEGQTDAQKPRQFRQQH
jgi:hypothetical protein